MLKAMLISLILGTSLFFLSCAKDSKPDQPVFDPYFEPSPEAESKIQLVINFDGKWKKESTGSKAVIIIKGRTGRIIGKNGAEIPIIVRYINEKTVKILENEYNPEYLANWLPDTIARQIYNDDFLKKTYSILKIIDEDTLRGTSYAWEVYHNNKSVQKIESLVSSEEWKRVKD
jgi:hypothetical protein